MFLLHTFHFYQYRIIRAHNTSVRYSFNLVKQKLVWRSAVWARRLPAKRGSGNDSLISSCIQQRGTFTSN